MFSIQLGFGVIAILCVILALFTPGQWRILFAVIIIITTILRLYEPAPASQFDRSGSIHTTVRVISVDRNPWGLRILATTPQNQRILVTTKASLNPLPVNGDQFQIDGEWRPVPAVRNPGEFNYRSYLKLNKIVGTVRAEQLILVQKAPQWHLPAQASRFRQHLAAVHHKALPHPYDDLLGSFIFGDYGISLPADISQMFRTLGLTHLLVVSGAQVALISGFLTLTLRPLIPNTRVLISVITVVNVGFYFVTGGGPSIFRAIVTTEISMIIALNLRNTHWTNKLALTAIILILIRPQAVLDIGAQLSFLATIALLYLAPAIGQKIPPRIPGWIRTTLTTTLATFLLTIPISIYNFNQISWVSIPANFCVVLGAEWLVIVGFIATFSYWIWAPFAQILFEFCLLGLVAIMKIALFFSNLQPVPTYIRQPPSLLIGFYYIAILSLGSELAKTLPRRLTIITGFIGIGLIWHFSTSLGSELPLELTFLDVGQGDATLINIGYRQYVMVDFGDSRFTPTNGDPSIFGGRVIAQTLRAKGTNRIDLAVVTHTHKDHYGGLAEVAGQFAIGTLLVNRRSDRKILSHYLEIRNRLNQNEMGFRHIRLHGNTQLTVFHPIKGLPIDKNENNNSIVMKLEKDKFSALLTGDLEHEREQWLVDAYGKKLRSLVLKVGHHGSLTSSSAPFLDAVNPKIAVISCGSFNRYRHPRPATIQRLDARHILTYRTDRSGAITIKTDGQGYQILTTR